MKSEYWRRIFIAGAYLVGGLGLLVGIPALNNTETEKAGRFTIWLSKTVEVTGYEADGYSRTEEIITFTDKSTGRTISRPSSSVWNIEENE